MNANDENSHFGAYYTEIWKIIVKKVYYLSANLIWRVHDFWNIYHKLIWKFENLKFSEYFVEMQKMFEITWNL